MLGARGVEKVFEVDLAPDEKAMLDASIRLCSESIAEARKLLVPEPALASQSRVALHPRVAPGRRRDARDLEGSDEGRAREGLPRGLGGPSRVPPGRGPARVTRPAPEPVSFVRLRLAWPKTRGGGLSPGVPSRRLPQTLVLTGASGFVGRHLLDELKDDYRIFAIARRSQHDCGAASPPEHRLDAGGHRATARASPGPSARSRPRAGAKFLVHLAAYYDFTGEDHPEYRRTNIDGTRNVLEAARAARIGGFVFGELRGGLRFPAARRAGRRDDAPRRRRTSTPGASARASAWCGEFSPRARPASRASARSTATGASTRRSTSSCAPGWARAGGRGSSPGGARSRSPTSTSGTSWPSSAAAHVLARARPDRGPGREHGGAAPRSTASSSSPPQSYFGRPRTRRPPARAARAGSGCWR